MKILALPSDGIGPEIAGAAVHVAEAASERFGLGLEFDYDDVGFASLKKYGTILRDETLTDVHKASSFHMTDGLFLECVRAVGGEFPEVELDDLLIDASTAHRVRNPERNRPAKAGGKSPSSGEPYENRGEGDDAGDPASQLETRHGTQNG
jgi:isocitrate/isopropylmalate dehydrogenase